ncbi:hypothetical protein B2K_40235 [Paenibacillus mucilaginosus K02]|uniref:Uncharacterized protein n=1 Tax=Paenibacillus mucilaginosus K02 TaxID=997761 RepID=R9UNF9_9BACL|nr:hypothetical protein B2K_40235 [Paenibacillus mucilaginosus K02]
MLEAGGPLGERQIGLACSSRRSLKQAERVAIQ